MTVRLRKKDALLEPRLAFWNFLPSYLGALLTDKPTSTPQNMRAEIETLASEIKQSVELLRRHL